MKTYTIADIRDMRPCYDPVTGISVSESGDVIHPGGYLPEDWTGTAVDILDVTDCPPEDRLWVVSHWLDDRTLRLLAVWCARQALALIDNPDPRSIAACDVAERYALGNATDDELDAAWDAAWDVANDAARAAVRAVACDEARDAARAAVRAAAGAAARDAAGDAAGAAAWDAARAAAGAAARAAAGAAAWDAARAAAWATQIAHLRKMIVEAQQ